MITLQQRSRRLSADLETPISLFLSLTQNKIPGLLLESAEVDGRWGRYSIIACDYLMTVSCVDARLSLSIKDDRLASLKELEGMPYLDGLRSLMQRLELVGDDMRQAPITRALYGYFGYETAALFQPRLAQAIPASSAESCLVLAGTVILTICTIALPNSAWVNTGICPMPRSMGRRNLPSGKFPAHRTRQPT